MTTTAGQFCSTEGTSEIDRSVMLAKPTSRGPQLRKPLVVHVIDVDDLSVESAPPRPPGHESHEQHRVVLAHQRVVDLVLDAPFHQIIFELIESFKSLRPP